LEKREIRKVLFTLAETLSVEKTCQNFGMETSELRKLLLGLFSAPEEKKDSSEAGLFVLCVDGASKGNPGPAGAGVVIMQKREIMEELAQYLGEMTNNQAEYRALIIGLKRLREIRAQSVEVRSDSELMVRQIRGAYRVKDPDLRRLYKQVKDLIAGFQKFSIKHIPREQNKKADLLANRAIDEFV
jgi:ribonuclease HI